MSQERDKSSSSNDIRGQLSDIQNRLFNSSKDDKSVKKKANMKPSFSTGNIPGGASVSSTSSPSTTATSQHLVPSLGPESKGNDMNYVVGLSQNLVQECRRLTLENQKLKTKLKSNMEDVDNYKQQITSLNSRRDLQITNEGDLKDKNWELESDNLNLKEQINDLLKAKEKISQSIKERDLKINSFQKINDDLQL